MRKIKFFTVLTVALALMTGMTSCNNDNEVVNYEIEKGLPTTMGITISTRGPQTYAEGDDNDANAKVEELALNKVDVLIYAETTTPGNYLLEQIKTLGEGDFEAVEDDPNTYTLKAIETTTGNKKIHVAMNYPGTLPALNTSLSALADWTYTLTTPTALSANGLAMFSVKEEAAELVADPEENEVEITVKRMVAKFTVHDCITRDDGEPIKVQGGVMTDLSFAIAQANTEIFAVQRRVATDGKFVVQDPNWSSFKTDDFFATPTAYNPVDESDVTTALATAVYAPENTSEKHHVDGDNLTYISVRAKYTPDSYSDADGNKKSARTETGDPDSFWTVVKPDGTILYFDVEADADTYKGKTAGSIKSDKYEDGLCYFRAYVNKNATPDGNITDSKAGKFDILRNNYYKVQINSIKAPGKPADEGKVTDETSLMVDVQVEAWFPVTDNIDL